MTHQDFLEWRIGQRYQENSYYGYQCVALVKLYILEIYKERLWSFWWSALSWWKNNNWTFNKYTRIINDYWDPSNYPRKWDIIFFNNMFWVYGHVAIVDSSDGYSIRVIEQNWESWNWLWRNGDEIRYARYWFKDVMWRYRHPSADPIVAPKIETEIETPLDPVMPEHDHKDCQSCQQKLWEILAHVKAIQKIYWEEHWFECQQLIQTFWSKPLRHEDKVFYYKMINDHPDRSGAVEQIFFNNAFMQIEWQMNWYKFIRSQLHPNPSIEIIFTKNWSSLMPLKDDWTPFVFKSRSLAFAFSPSSKYAWKIYVNTEADIKIFTDGQNNAAVKVFTHEWLHALWLWHSDDPESIMYFENQKDKRINFTQEDKNLLNELYP